MDSKSFDLSNVTQTSDWNAGDLNIFAASLLYTRSTVSMAGRGASSSLREWCIETQIANWKWEWDAASSLLMSGDGDYEPLIEEVLRNGVQVFLSAFSHGLNPRLRDIVDVMYELDGTTWTKRP